MIGEIQNGMKEYQNDTEKWKKYQMVLIVDSELNL